MQHINLEMYMCKNLISFKERALTTQRRALSLSVFVENHNKTSLDLNFEIFETRLNFPERNFKFYGNAMHIFWKRCQIVHANLHCLEMKNETN